MTGYGLKRRDPTNYPWITAPERNSPDNLRLLVKKLQKAKGYYRR